jgi:DNA-binding NarL/FixJ family response regulator
MWRASMSEVTSESQLNTEPPVAVAIVHGRAVMREGLSQLLSRQRGINMVGLFGSASEILEHPIPGEVVVLYDRDTVRRDGTAALRELRQEVEAKVLMINVPNDDGAIIECVRAGVSGCILEDVSVEGLVIAIRSTARGAPPASPRVITSLFNHIANHQGQQSRQMAGLTRREEEILKLIAEGYSNKEIATRLYLQHQTVKNHVRAIFNKLDVHSRLEVVRSHWAHTR